MRKITIWYTSDKREDFDLLGSFHIDNFVLTFKDGEKQIYIPLFNVLRFEVTQS
jgi:hypothetical protein